jgi:thermostable 8-oxoguanine DNA glycosylase
MRHGESRPVQTAFRRRADNAIEMLELPSALASLLPSLKWGDIGVLFTPAWWAVQHWHFAERWTPQWQRLGRNLREETIACILGTAGVPAEVAHGAFRALQDSGVTLMDPIPEAAAMKILAAPVSTPDGQSRRYRFAQRKAGFLAELPAPSYFDAADQLDDLSLRDRLTELSGVGLKVASWVVRNHRNSQRVAILDVHIRRAGVLTGFLTPDKAFTSSYHELEAAFLRFAQSINAAPASLDCLMWLRMRSANYLALKELRSQNIAA